MKSIHFCILACILLALIAGAGAAVQYDINTRPGTYVPDMAPKIELPAINSVPGAIDTTHCRPIKVSSSPPDTTWIPTSLDSETIRLYWASQYIHPITF